MPLDELAIESEALRRNPLGDPHVRPLWVYTPPGYEGGPAIYVLQGYTGQVDMWRNRTAFRPTIFELLDREHVVGKLDQGTAEPGELVGILQTPADLDPQLGQHVERCRVVETVGSAASVVLDLQGPGIRVDGQAH